MSTRRTKVSTMIGRKFAKATLRKFTGGEIVQKRGKGKKFICCVNGHESDFNTPSNKHSYYRIARGRTQEWVRSDYLVECSA